MQNYLTAFCRINVKLLLQVNEGFLTTDHMVSKFSEGLVSTNSELVT
jgi:hypothetical protein